MLTTNGSTILEANALRDTEIKSGSSAVLMRMECTLRKQRGATWRNSIAPNYKNGGKYCRQCWHGCWDGIISWPGKWMDTKRSVPSVRRVFAWRFAGYWSLKTMIAE